MLTLAPSISFLSFIFACQSIKNSINKIPKYFNFLLFLFLYIFRIRNSRGSLDSIGTAAASSAASQASSSGGSNTKMDMSNGGIGNGSGNNSINNSPQHSHHQHSPHRSGNAIRNNARDNWSKMPEPLKGHKSEQKDKSSPSRCTLTGTSSSSKQGSPSGRTKGVPPSFGYVKRANGTATSTAEQQQIAMMINVGNGGPQNGRTAHVSAVPRTAAGGNGRKMSGGTQTLPSDITSMY